ncbi:MAG: hypothetical protein J2P22_13855 [Nocardioides sp.]|nr:hypothetical protein [Nocardioides sp.]
MLDAADLIAPGLIAGSIRAERDEVAHMYGMTDAMGAPYMSKLTRDSYHGQNRKRGRRPESGV